MNNDLNSSSRSQYRSKRKKTNYILNGLIVVVLLLIAFVAYSIFSSGNNKAASKKSEQKTTSVQSADKKKSNQSDKKSSVSTGTKKDKNSSDQANSSTDSTTASSADDSQAQAVVTEGGTSPNAEQTIENPDWKSVGTSQTGEHTPVYDSSSTDWQEMLKAISYATGLDQNNMTVWFLGRDKSNANGSVGTVSSKDKQHKYRVYINWVDGEGWKPTKVEQLTDVSQDH